MEKVSITIEGDYQVVRQKIVWHEWNTFDEWSCRGYTIRKGSKATDIEGKKYFHETQVFKRPFKRYGTASNKTYKSDMQMGDVDEMSSWTGESSAMDFYS